MSEPSWCESSGLVSLTDEQRVAELIGQSVRVGGRWSTPSPACGRTPTAGVPAGLHGWPGPGGRRDRPRWL